MKIYLNLFDKVGWELAEVFSQGIRITNLRKEGSVKTVPLKLPKRFYI